MRIRTLHCDNKKYKPLKKALKQPEELSEEKKEEIEIKECLVVLTAVEKPDTINLVTELVKNIEEIAKQVNAKKIVLYPYAHLSSNLSSPDIAQAVLEKAEQELKKAKYEVTKAPFGYYKEFELKCKGHPLSELSKEFRVEGVVDAAKKPIVEKKQQSSGKIILDRRNLKPNDHRIIGEDLGIFHLSDEVGPGLPLWLPKGEILRDQLERYMRTVEINHGYQHVTTPHITKGHLYEKT